MKNNTFFYGEDFLTVSKAISLVHGELKGKLSNNTKERIEKSRAVVEKMAQNKKSVYGINTGFGQLCTKKISPEETKILQKNIIMSHSSGVGEPVYPPVAKLMMILKVHALSQGNSGVALSTIERIMFFIDNDIIPIVPIQGSVGASGDLAPLSHLFLPLIGMGHVYYEDEIIESEKFLKKLKLSPLELGPKEGLGLINGTQFMAAHGIYGVMRLYNCLEVADLAAAMSLEALNGTDMPYLKELHEVRPHRGAVYVAAHLRAMLKNSELSSKNKDYVKIQDPYSIRCVPQVHGASRDAWLHLKEVIVTEINSVTDNPIILESGQSVSGGHFHGQPLALPFDYASIAACELGNISDRRVYLLLMGENELPKLLLKETGLQSGFMIPQYATAALVSENKSLCHPASTDSIPTSLGQEDHVSMGSIGARKLNTIIDNLEKILGIELFCAAQGLDFRKPKKAGEAVSACYKYIRKDVKHLKEDAILATEMEKIIEMVSSGELLEISQNNFEINDIEEDNIEDYICY